MTIVYMFTWMMVFLRSTGLMLLLPTLAGRTAPIKVRLGLAACIATLLAGIVPPGTMPSDNSGLFFASAGEVMLGLALGFVGQMAFYAVDFAARIIASEIGISASPGIDGPSEASDPPAMLMSGLAIMVFFFSGGHLSALTAFARSFELAHAGRPLIDPSATEVISRATSHLIEVSLRMAAPYLALNFLVTMAFAVLGRVVPRMGVFVLSGAVRSIAGVTLFSGAGALIARYLYVEFSDAPLQMLQLLPRR
jgi:flagellar biosynthetic protein FliR